MIFSAKSGLKLFHFYGKLKKKIQYFRDESKLKTNSDAAGIQKARSAYSNPGTSPGT